MWDRLIVDCKIATLEGGGPGVIENGAIGISDGKIVRAGKRTELAGYRSKTVDALDGAWVTPGLIDCHTHLVFGGTRASEHAMRRAGASYEEIAKAGGGIASTVSATKKASDSELRQLETAKTLREQEPVRIVATLLALHALPKGADRGAFIKEATARLIPEAARRKLATSVDAFCETIAFTPAEVERVFTAARAHGLGVRLHAEQLSNQKGAEIAAKYKALSADHLEHLDAAGAKAMARAGTIAVLLPGAFYTLQESRKPPVQLLRDHKVPIAIATDCNPGTSPLLNPQLAMNMACTLFGLTPEEAIAGMTINGARALGLAHELGSIAAGKAADLCVWRIADLAELGYWVGLMPERRIYAGIDS